MDLQDQELLDKQLRNLHAPPRRDGVVIATIVAVFLGGMMIGGLLAKPPAPTRTAANAQLALVQNDAATSARQ
jgi:hypothetical protein